MSALILARALEIAKSHWLLLIAVLAALACFIAGRESAPRPPPAIHETVAATSASRATRVEHQTIAAREVVRVVTVREPSGEVTTTSTTLLAPRFDAPASDTTVEHARERASLAVAPLVPDAPRLRVWGAAGWEPLALRVVPDLRIGADVRVAGPLWITASAAPGPLLHRAWNAAGWSVGALVAVEW